MLMEAILVGLWAALCGIDKFDVFTGIHRPLVTGTVVGLILGDLQMGLIAGATFELAWLGLVANAGVQPPDTTVGAIVGTMFAIKLDMSPEAAIGMAIPFALAMQTLVIFLFTSCAPMMQKADEYAEECNIKGIDNLLYTGLSLRATLYAIVGFSAIYFGANGAAFIQEYLPEDMVKGMAIAGGMMPAVGFAMLLRTMFNTHILPYFFLGFVCTTYFDLPILAVAVIFTSIAVLDYLNQNLSKNNEENNAKEFNDEL
ncbi:MULTISPECIES: PTS N-acetylgalactosamine transporter subunit IIC [Vibrio]|uniref:PTS N-acetylgalactosamine transporter subunit IIC n=1 Tax=Vibrio TaxID=662 RepID=UPI000BFFA164|nr:PTS N-acetylgalactosamine transporter subunit IIC [Vibrio sp. PID17_43]PHJ41636.1 PTS N-acetylgalactosamine transporter subunit IIC [Vibrio sp. PID17_43]